MQNVVDNIKIHKILTNIFYYIDLEIIIIIKLLSNDIQQPYDIRNIADR